MKIIRGKYHLWKIPLINLILVYYASFNRASKFVDALVQIIFSIQNKSND